MKIAQFLILKKDTMHSAKKKKQKKPPKITLTSPFKELSRVNNPTNYYVHV